MKNNFKSILIGVAFIAVALVGYKAYDRATMTPEEYLFQQNLEALTGNEHDEVTCEKDYGDTCLVGKTPVPDYDEVESWW